MKKIFQLFLVLILSALVLSSCSNNTNSDSWEELNERGYFILGLDDTFAPMGFKDSNGEFVGFDVELAEEVGKRIGLDVKFQPIDWSLKKTELNAKNIDVIWNGYTITESRKEKVAFSNPYLDNSQIIVTMSDSNIIKKSDMDGKIVAVQKESSAYDAVIKDTQFVNSLGEEIIQFDTNNEAFMDLEAKRVDAIVVDEVLARYYMKLRGEEKYSVLQEDFGKEQYGIGMRKEDKILLEKINNAMEEMKNDGTYDSVDLLAAGVLVSSRSAWGAAAPRD